MNYFAFVGGQVIPLTDSEYTELFGEQTYRHFANDVYRGTLTLNEVPVEHRDAVAKCITARVQRFGAYADQAVTASELARVAVQFSGDSGLTRGATTRMFAALRTLRTNAPDAVASTAAYAYTGMHYDNELITAGTRINWKGRLVRAAVDIWDRPENNPDNAPTCWDEIPYRDGVRIIPDKIYEGQAFTAGEYGWWGNLLYESVLDNNVWTPVENPTGWKLVDTE